METVILNTVWVGTIHYTSGIMKSKVENLYNIFCNNDTRIRYPLEVNGSSQLGTWKNGGNHMDNHNRFREILLNVLNNKGYIVYADDYPDYLEVDIQRAVYYKRNKRYDEAIKIYLDVFENCKGVYPSIMEYLYKAVLCNGELVFAYETILYAELFAKKCWGYHSFLGDWSQAIKRKEFENIIIEYFK